MKAPKSNIVRTLVSEGTHHAILIGIIEIGTVDVEWKGKTKMMPKVRFTFEITDEKKEFKEGEGEKPLVISQEYTYSMGEKAKLRAITEGIIGASLLQEEADGFDHEELLGKNCLLTVKHKVSGAGNKYQYVDGASALLKSMLELTPENPIKVLNYEKWNTEIFDALPDFIKEQMQATPEYQSKFGASAPSDAEKKYDEIDSDEIPF